MRDVAVKTIGRWTWTVCLIASAVLIAACSTASAPPPAPTEAAPAAKPAAPAPTGEAPPAAKPAAPAPTVAAASAPKPASELPTSAELQAYKDAVTKATARPAWQDYKPSKAAPPFQSGKKAGIIISNSRGDAVVLIGKGTAEAAEVVGWTSKTYDGMGNADGYNAAFRQALAEGFDGIILGVIFQQLVTDPLRQANQTKIPVVSANAANDAGNGPIEVYADAGGDDSNQAQQLVNWMVADADGKKVNAVVFTNPSLRVLERRLQGAEAGFANCRWCTLASKELYTSNTADQLTVRTQAIIQSRPEVNYIFVDAGPFARFAYQGVKQMGADVANRVKIVSFDCIGDQVQRIKAGDVEAACYAFASEAAGWAAIDEMNRAFNGAPRADVRVPTQLITRDNVDQITDPKGFTGGFDFRASWKEFWNIK